MNVDNTKKKISDSLASHIFLFKYAGFWIPDNLSFIKKNIYKTYSAAIMLFIFCMFSLCLVASVVVYFKDLEKLTQALFLLLTVLAEIAKVVPFLTKHEELKDMVQALDEVIFKPKIKKHIDFVNGKKKFIKYMFICLMCLYETTVTLFAIFPLFEEKRRLPFSWYPDNTENFLWYLITYIYQIFGGMYLAGLNGGLDTFISGMMVNITAQLDVLLEKLENGCEIYWRGYRQERSLDMEKENEEFIKECAIHHEAIIR